jgi:endonuclease-3 related protein
MTKDPREIADLYGRLAEAFGAQGWWPARTTFEVVVGAVLTQNTNWKNVEKAIACLRSAAALTPGSMESLSQRRLASLIRSSGCYNVKARRLRSFLRYLRERHGLRMKNFLETPTGRLRRELLEIGGIGPETADSILLYAAGRPVFVVDAYTRRVFSRHGYVDEEVNYGGLQEFFQSRLPEDAGLFNEFHALIVRLGKEYCRPRRPQCGECPLGPWEVGGGGG